MPRISRPVTYFFFFLVFLFCYFLSINSNHADYDLWHRMALGALFFQNGHLPEQDVFAYTPVKAVWIDHEWGAGILFYWLGQTFGDHGLILFKFACAAGVVALIFLIQKQLAADRFRYGLLYSILACLVIWPGFITTLRAQVFTYLFFTLWIYLLEKIRRNQYGLAWLLPATMIVWSNVHGGSTAGVGLVVLYLAGELLNGNRPFRYVVTLGAVIAASLINPYGISCWQHIVEATTMDRPYLLEWTPYDPFGWRPDQVAFNLFFLIMAGSALFWLTKSPRKIDWVKVLVVSVTLYLTAKHTRHLVFWGIAVSIFCHDSYIRMADLFSGRLHRAVAKILPESFFPVWNLTRHLAGYGIFSVFLLIQTVGMPVKVSVPEYKYPLGGIAFIQENGLRGNLMLPFRWGGYAQWKLYPQCLVSLDSRFELVYQNETYTDIMRFFRDPARLDSFQGVLEKYPPDIVMVLPGTETEKRLVSLSAWVPVYRDRYSAVYLPVGHAQGSWALPDRQLSGPERKYEHFMP